MLRAPHPDLVAAIPRLRRYARVLTGESSRADDLVQDTLATRRQASRLAVLRRELREVLDAAGYGRLVDRATEAALAEILA